MKRYEIGDNLAFVLYMLVVAVFIICLAIWGKR